MTIPDIVSENEDLGRAIFDSGKARDASVKGKIHPRIFIEKDLVPDLSVDRLSFGAHVEIAQIQDAARGRSCLGWAVVACSDALRNGSDVKADKLPGNDYHALIILATAESEEEFITSQRELGIALALASRWLQRP